MIDVKSHNKIDIDVFNVSNKNHEELKYLGYKYIPDTLLITLGSKAPEFTITTAKSPFLGKPRTRIKITSQKPVDNSVLYALLLVVKKITKGKNLIHVTQKSSSFLDGATEKE